MKFLEEDISIFEKIDLMIKEIQDKEKHEEFFILKKTQGHRTDEEKELDQKIVKTLYSKETLCTDIFEKKGDQYVLNEGVRDKLIKISNAFVGFIGVDIFIYDVVLTGSLANYNWSEYSDIDVHILVDLDEIIDDKKNSKIIEQIMIEFFKSKKDVWNENHDIKIKGYEVELYVQDIDEKHISAGVYSILNNKWIIEPKRGKDSIDDNKIISKSEEYASIIDNLVEKSANDEDIMPEIDDVRKKLKRFRQSGLEEGGEYSYENLTFKLLRRNGYIEKLFNLRKHVMDKKLSVQQ